MKKKSKSWLQCTQTLTTYNFMTLHCINDLPLIHIFLLRNKDECFKVGKDLEIRPQFHPKNEKGIFFGYFLH